MRGGFISGAYLGCTAFLDGQSRRNYGIGSGDWMFRRRDEVRERLLEVIEKFRQKGATSPEEAMTAEELGLPPKFQEMMKRRLGQIGVFKEVDGKYYMSEERLKEVKEQMAKRQRRSSW